jgi:hypothetical protein
MKKMTISNVLKAYYTKEESTEVVQMLIFNGERSLIHLN